MKNNSISKSLKLISKAFRRYNVTIFIVTMVGGLVLAVYTLTSILTTPATTGPDGTLPNPNNTFDEETVKRLNNLQSSDGSSSTTLPTGRISPFSE